MLKASAPQKSTRRGSWCLAVVLDSRIPSHLLLEGNSKGFRRWHNWGGIEVVGDGRSEVE